MIRRPPRSTLFPYTDALPICERERGGPVPLDALALQGLQGSAVLLGVRRRLLGVEAALLHHGLVVEEAEDRKSTRLNSSHANISYAVFCLKKKKHMI